MQFGKRRGNPFRYRTGGTIIGDYSYVDEHKIRMRDSADIVLALEDARIQQQDDADNFVCFKPDEFFVAKTLNVAGDLVVQGETHSHDKINDLHVEGHLVVDGQTTLKDVEGDDLHVKGNLTVDGNTSVQALTSTSLHTNKIFATVLKNPMTFEGDLTGSHSIIISTGPLDHEVHIGNDRIELIDHNILQAGHIKLDTSSGSIFCNGGIQCYNDNPATNLVNPKGVVTDFVTTQAHRSDFGMNAAGESITCSGQVKAVMFRVPSLSGLPDFGGISPTSVYHQVSMVTRSMYAAHYYAQDSDESAVHIDMENNDIDLNVSDTTVVKIHSGGTKMYGEIDFTGADSLRFTGLTEDKIIGWPLPSGSDGPKNVVDNAEGVVVYANDQHVQKGSLEAFEVEADHGLFNNLVAGGNVDFKHAIKIDFTGVAPEDIVGWPLPTGGGSSGPKNVVDNAEGVVVYVDAQHVQKGSLEAFEVEADYGLFDNLVAAGNVDFKNAIKIDFTGVAPEDIVGWPLPTGGGGPKNVVDSADGVIVYENSSHEDRGFLQAADVNAVRLTVQDATFGDSNTGTIDFTDVSEIDFTGLPASAIKGWPLHTRMQNIADVQGGVRVEGNLQADNVLVNALLETDKVRTDFIEPHQSQVLRINGFDQVRVSDELNVVGRSIFQEVSVTGNLMATAATFTDKVKMEYFAEVAALEIGQADIQTTEEGATPQKIHMQTYSPDSSSAFLKCYLGPTDEYQRMSLGHDGFFIGQGGFAFRENRKTRLFRSSQIYNNETIDYINTYVGDNWVSTMTNDRAIFSVKVSAPNIDSSGSFTHCHVCEPVDQTVAWSSLTGRLVESTGQCAVRDDTGVLISDFKQTPGLSYAMPSVRVAETSVLGVLLSVEEVEEQFIHHAHGIELRHKVAEADGHKMLRVCGAGDCMVWVVKPLGSERFLNAKMLAGMYTRYENGIEQPDKVVMTCHEDFSFQWMTAGTNRGVGDSSHAVGGNRPYVDKSDIKRPILVKLWLIVVFLAREIKCAESFTQRRKDAVACKHHL